MNGIKNAQHKAKTFQKRSTEFLNEQINNYFKDTANVDIETVHDFSSNMETWIKKLAKEPIVSENFSGTNKHSLNHYLYKFNSHIEQSFKNKNPLLSAKGTMVVKECKNINEEINRGDFTKKELENYIQQEKGVKKETGHHDVWNFRQSFGGGGR